MRQVLAFVLFIASCCSFAQEKSELELKRSKWQVSYFAIAKEFVKSFETPDGISAFSDSIQRLYYQDTFVVNKVYQEMIAFDGSTLGMNQANMYSTADYEVLILKYVAIINGKLLPDDKKIFAETNEAWQTYYNKQKELVGALMQPIYNGGGSIQTIIYSGRIKALQQERLQQLIDLLKDFV